MNTSPDNFYPRLNFPTERYDIVLISIMMFTVEEIEFTLSHGHDREWFMSQADKYRFSERGFADRRPLFAKRRVVISEIGWRAGWRMRGRRVRERPEGGEGFTFEQASDSLLQSLRYRRSQTLRCEYVTATEYRLRSEYREEGKKKKSRTTSFLRAMIVARREAGIKRRWEEEGRGEGSPSNSYPALMLLGLLWSAVAGDPFSIARETGREIEISFSLGPPTLFGPWLRESASFS